MGDLGVLTNEANKELVETANAGNSPYLVYNGLEQNRKRYTGSVKTNGKEWKNSEEAKGLIQTGQAQSALLDKIYDAQLEYCEKNVSDIIEFEQEKQQSIQETTDVVIKTEQQKQSAIEQTAAVEQNKQQLVDTNNIDTVVVDEQKQQQQTARLFQA